jgi:hypothetical protein
MVLPNDNSPRYALKVIFDIILLVTSEKSEVETPKQKQFVETQ